MDIPRKVLKEHKEDKLRLENDTDSRIPIITRANLVKKIGERQYLIDNPSGIFRNKRHPLWAKYNRYHILTRAREENVHGIPIMIPVWETLDDWHRGRFKFLTQKNIRPEDKRYSNSMWEELYNKASLTNKNKIFVNISPSEERIYDDFDNAMHTQWASYETTEQLKRIKKILENALEHGQDAKYYELDYYGAQLNEPTVNEQEVDLENIPFILESYDEDNAQRANMYDPTSYYLNHMTEKVEQLIRKEEEENNQEPKSQKRIILKKVQASPAAAAQTTAASTFNHTRARTYDEILQDATSGRMAGNPYVLDDDNDIIRRPRQRQRRPGEEGFGVGSGVVNLVNSDEEA